MLAVQLCCARHCELPLSKMGNKGLFPGVAVPLAFFCTLFFRHRKKSVSAPWDGQSQLAPESARQPPSWRGFAPAGALGAFRSPPVPFGSPHEVTEHPIGLQALLPRRSRRVRPHQREFLAAKLLPVAASRVAFRSPPCTPFGKSAYQWCRDLRLRARQRAFLGANNQFITPLPFPQRQKAAPEIPFRSGF